MNVFLKDIERLGSVKTFDTYKMSGYDLAKSDADTPKRFLNFTENLPK